MQLEEYPVQFDDWRDFILSPTTTPSSSSSPRKAGGALPVATVLPTHRRLDREKRRLKKKREKPPLYIPPAEPPDTLDESAPLLEEASAPATTTTTTTTSKANNNITRHGLPSMIENHNSTPASRTTDLLEDETTTRDLDDTVRGCDYLMEDTTTRDLDDTTTRDLDDTTTRGDLEDETTTRGDLEDETTWSGTSDDEKIITTGPKPEPENPIWLCVMYGLINATIVLPVLMSFASIIYRDPAFAPAMPTLVKLTLVSGMIHQVCFSTFSSLPFAVGQVQDAGLIFLSSMATTIVDYCRSHGHDLETVLATATIGIPMATAFLGVGLIVLGRWQLAQYVQLLPTSVVGGYLAYIGWFCGLAGVGLMSGGASDINWSLVSDNWYLILPGVLSGLLLYICVRTLRHMAVLPCGILLLLALFYVVMWGRGSSIEDVTEHGWIRQTDTDSPLSWTDTWDLMKFDKVAWGVMPSLFLTELSMIFVVALSSSLDVAAIEIELQRPLDYNHELQTVGLSNLVSGLTGGYTGSYIFSQSIFSLRAGIRSRLAGYVLAGCQLVVFLLPFPILAYVPNFFFGSLLSLICVDLLYEWLWQVRDKVTAVEYVICLSTFGLIQWAGVEYGVVLGVFLYLAFRQVGLNVGNQTEDAEDEGNERRDSLVPMRKEAPRAENGQTSSSQYGALDISEFP